MKFIGMEPAIKPAALSTRTGVIGVLATAGTLKADKYLLNRGKWADNVRIVEHVGQGFVELVESGKTDGKEAEDIVRESLRPLLDEGADRIVLGCTHYPHIKDAISKHIPTRVRIYDGGAGTARETMRRLREAGLLSDRGEGGKVEILNSSGDEALIELSKQLLYR